MKVDLIYHFGNEEYIASCARVSFSSDKKKRSDQDLIRFLFRNGHLSPFEMAEMVFSIECPIFVARQILRHRTASVSEISGRHNQSYFRKFYLPNKFRYQSIQNKQKSEGEFSNEQLRSELISFYSSSFELYQNLLKNGVARELARIVLPLSTYTKFVWKMDLRNLMNFLKERMASEAQHEIRYVAKKIFGYVEQLFPTVSQCMRETFVLVFDDGFDETSFEVLEV